MDKKLTAFTCLLWAAFQPLATAVKFEKRLFPSDVPAKAMPQNLFTFAIFAINTFIHDTHFQKKHNPFCKDTN
jgi:hypothetical protein